MEPLSNQQFSHDAVKFVYQQCDIPILPHHVPMKEFKIKAPEKANKAKKGQAKNRDQQKAD